MEQVKNPLAMEKCMLLNAHRRPTNWQRDEVWISLSSVPTTMLLACPASEAFGIIWYLTSCGRLLSLSLSATLYSIIFYSISSTLHSKNIIEKYYSLSPF